MRHEQSPIPLAADLDRPAGRVAPGRRRGADPVVRQVAAGPGHSQPGGDAGPHRGGPGPDARPDDPVLRQPRPPDPGGDLSLLFSAGSVAERFCHLGRRHPHPRRDPGEAQGRRNLPGPGRAGHRSGPAPDGRRRGGVGDSRRLLHGQGGAHTAPRLQAGGAGIPAAPGGAGRAGGDGSAAQEPDFPSTDCPLPERGAGGGRRAGDPGLRAGRRRLPAAVAPAGRQPGRRRLAGPQRRADGGFRLQVDGGRRPIVICLADLAGAGVRAAGGTGVDGGGPAGQRGDGRRLLPAGPPVPGLARVRPTAGHGDRGAGHVVVHVVGQTPAGA